MGPSSSYLSNAAILHFHDYGRKSSWHILLQHIFAVTFQYSLIYCNIPLPYSNDYYNVQHHDMPRCYTKDKHIVKIEPKQLRCFIYCVCTSKMEF